MAVTDLPYLNPIRKPSGKVYWQFRRGAFKAMVPGQPGDEQFHAKYSEYLSACQEKPAQAIEGSMSALIAAYKKSAEYAALRPPTQLDYGKTLDLIDEKMGPEPYRLVTGKMAKALRDKYSKTPRKAHKIKQMVSRLYTWGQEESLVKEGFNPAAAFKKLKVRAKPIIPWSEQEIAMFLAACPPHLKTVVLLALYTGQRAEDVVKMEWPAFQGSIIRVVQSKTGEPLDIACHRELRKHLASIKTVFKGRIARAANGRPYSANAFAKAIADFGKKIEGWPGNRSPHGLRYAAAGRLEEAGVTPADASSVLGHRTYQMAMKYLSQRKRSAAAQKAVENNA